MEANKGEINKQLVELSYEQILNRLKKEGEVSELFLANSRLDYRFFA